MSFLTFIKFRDKKAIAKYWGYGYYFVRFSIKLYNFTSRISLIKPSKFVRGAINRQPCTKGHLLFYLIIGDLIVLIKVFKTQIIGKKFF